MNSGSDDQIRDMLHDIPERLTVAADGVDSYVQQEYLEYTESLNLGQYSEEDISARSHILFSPDTPLKDKKETLVVLAHRGTLEAYRTIERFLETAEQTLEAWGDLPPEKESSYNVSKFRGINNHKKVHPRTNPASRSIIVSGFGFQSLCFYLHMMDID